MSDCTNNHYKINLTFSRDTYQKTQWHCDIFRQRGVEKINHQQVIFTNIFDYIKSCRLRPCGTNSSRDVQKMMNLKIGKITTLTAAFRSFSVSWKICCLTKHQRISIQRRCYRQSAVNWSLEGKNPTDNYGEKWNWISRDTKMKRFFKDFLEYQDSDARIKVHGFPIKKSSSSIELSFQPLIEEFVLVVLQNYEFENRDL